jgi:peptide deformylase
MALLKIARMGHPVLGARAQDVPDPAAPEIKRLVKDMIETMYDANGVGLAAPQIHVGLRLVVFFAPDERADAGAAASEGERNLHTAPLTVLINPQVEILDEEQEPLWEGCLSIPGLRGEVHRAAHLRYRGFDTDGKEIAREAKGFHARVVQHEFDHIEGRLYPTRMRDMKRFLFESEAQHWTKKEQA